MSTNNLSKRSIKVRTTTVVGIMGAIVAYLIGSGFATGQESMQYFSSFGLAGAIGALLITLALYCYFSSVALRDGRNLRLKSTNQIFEYYCGPWIGKFFGVFAPAFFFCMYAVMLSGAGAALNEHFGWHPQIGIVAMAVLTLTTVMLGLDGLVSVVSKLGPVIVALAIVVGIIGIVMNPAGLANSGSVISEIDILQAAPHWAISGIIFPALGILMLVPFLAGIARKTKNDKEARVSGFVGGLTFVCAVAIVSLGLLANIGDVYDKQIPMLWIADRVFSGSGLIFSFVVFAGIFTTAVPLLWVAINRIEQDDKSKRARLLAVIGTAVALLLAQVPFANLVNFLYPIAGYLTLILMAGIVVKQIRNSRDRKRSIDVYDVPYERFQEQEPEA